MKLVTISTIRNESDILEAFIRYHLQFVDHMIIINHRSADSSLDILRRMEQEGLPISIADVTDIEHQQGSVLTRFMKIAVREYDADWVIPLDADEFLDVSTEGSVREIMEKLPQDKVIKVPWRTYIPLPSDNILEPNVLRRIQHYRSKENHNLRKIVISRSMAMKKNAMIAPGNHGYLKTAFSNRKEIPYVPVDQLVFAHFPVRSSQQIMTKAFVGWLACLAKPNKLPGENHHLKLLFDRFKSGGQISPEELTSIALEYAVGPGTSALTENNIIHRPLVPEAGAIALRYTDTFSATPLPILAQIAEELAEALGAVRRKKSDGKNSAKMLGRWLRFLKRNAYA